MIRTNAEYLAKLARVEQLMNARGWHRDGKQLFKLAKQIIAWEDKHYPI